jgi:Uma2 family endonuclease
MTVETKLMTADELLAMPDDGFHRYELVRGELLTMSPAGAKHSRIALRIAVHLANYVADKGLGQVFGADTGFVISRDPDTVRAPDASFVRAERYVDVEEFFPGPPDLAVEVISPSDRYTEVDAKVSEYLDAGTRMVIVIHPAKKTATVTTRAGSSRLTINDTLTGADVVPGWSLPMRELFA